MKKASFVDWIVSALALPALIVAFTVVGPAPAQASAAAPAGDFFIITSVNLQLHELFLKAPTEVTELMLVSPSTKLLDEIGKPLALKDLRAGDTVYVTSTHSQSGEAMAQRIQIGPMTAEVLHSRYLNVK
ncbi:MAG: hypothetical protein ACRD3D_12175 [Terriglobia bacterium]